MRRKRYNADMSKYVALLRGMGPGDPKKSNASLRAVMEELGLQNVQTVISSGNVVFESAQEDIGALEAMIEAAWPEKRGFTATTIVKSEQQLQKLLDANPFSDLVHGPTSYMLVTFFKHPPQLAFELPYRPEGAPYQLLEYRDDALCSITDNTAVKTTDFMIYLEKQFGKEITSRTWLTLHRILKKMQAM
jgi:uncharacterized protein (DUF1697 family)